MKLPYCAPRRSACLALLMAQGCILPSKTVHSPVYLGHVLDAETKGPVHGAKVELKGPGLKASAKTDAAGAFAPVDERVLPALPWAAAQRGAHWLDQLDLHPGPLRTDRAVEVAP